jgi:hypothetical protein
MLLENLKGRHPLLDLSIDGKEPLKCITNEWGFKDAS